MVMLRALSLACISSVSAQDIFVVAREASMFANDANDVTEFALRPVPPSGSCHEAEGFLAAISPDDEGPYQDLCFLLKTNRAAHTIKNGPEGEGFAGRPFHDHTDHHLIALYRLGATSVELQATYVSDSKGSNPALPSAGLINASTWTDYIGACECGLGGGRTDIHFSDYAEFYAAEVRRIGPDETLLTYGPKLLDGLSGDLAHAVIELGYYFESGDERLVSEGLAWLSTAHVRLPQHDSVTPKGFESAEAALQALRDDARFPSSFPMENCPVLPGYPAGNICLNDAVHTLVSNRTYVEVLAEYDVAPAAEQLLDAAMSIFVGGGSQDFFTLHLVTGARAVSKILDGAAWPVQVRAAALSELWRLILYVYLARNRPELGSDAGAGNLRPWQELASKAIAIGDSHLSKIVMLSADEHTRRGLDIYHVAAEQAISLFESGKGWVH